MLMSLFPTNFVWTLIFQRASHVYSEAKRVHAFRDTVLSELRLVIFQDRNLDSMRILYILVQSM